MSTPETPSPEAFAASIIARTGGIGAHAYIAEAAALIRVRDAAIRAAAVGEAWRWIPCSERMPREGQTCLVLWGEHVQHVAYRWEGDGWTGHNDDGAYAEADTFSHWMPLPTPPEAP